MVYMHSLAGDLFVTAFRTHVCQIQLAPVLALRGGALGDAAAAVAGLFVMLEADGPKAFVLKCFCYSQLLLMQMPAE